MFIIYTSNNLNILLSQIIKIIKKEPLSSIFEKEIIIHDNSILFQYLNIFIAYEVGISSQFKLYNINDFIEYMLAINKLKKKLRKTCTASILTWNIMDLLDKKKFSQYIHQKNNQDEKFNFSSYMANIFLEYLVNCPNWLHAWSNNRKIFLKDQDEIWQIKLWQALCKNNNKNQKYHENFSYLFYHISSLINKNIKKYLPKRVFVFSSLSLKPQHIDLLKKISQYITVYFLQIQFLNVNIFNKKKECFNKYNPLFYNSDYNKNICNTCITQNKYKKNSLLNHIQHDLLKKNKIKKENIINKKDQSISINIFFNKKNEIEMLHKKLLTLFEKNKTLKMHEVVVTSFQLNEYLPFINCIFQSVHSQKKIPFFISLNHSKKIDIIFSTFYKILNLSYSRCTNEEILMLLRVEEISKNFNISNEEIDILDYWIKKTNIRWAINNKNKKFLSILKNHQNTWIYGIEKLLLSYAMNNTKNIWNNILACCIVNGSQIDVLEKLIVFINIIKKWQKKLSQSMYLIEWYKLSEELFHDFFGKNIKKNSSILIIKKKWDNMLNAILLSNYQKKISVDLLKKQFSCQSHNKYKHFSINAVNFCHPSSICYIPFKIVFMIGEDHYSVPHTNHLDHFNLLNKYSPESYLNNFEKYVYLFLQIINSCQKTLYISYVGYSEKDNSIIHPSIIIDQLLEYIQSNFYIRKNYTSQIKENKQKIIQHICHTYNKEYFYQKKIITNSSFIKKNNHVYQMKEEKDKKNTIYNITLNDFIWFWKNPIRFFCNYRLNIKKNYQEMIHDTTEPFSVNTKNCLKINNIMLNNIIHGKNTEKLFQYYLLSGILPYGSIGENFWKIQQKKMKDIAKIVCKYRKSTITKKIHVIFKNVQISGELHEIQETGLLRWTPNVLNYTDYIALWIEHLLYSTTGSFKESTIIGYKNSIFSFNPLSEKKAWNYLKKYINGYLKGIEEYPILLIKSGLNWLNQVYDYKNKTIKTDHTSMQKGYKSFLDTWHGNRYYSGEKNNYYIKKIIRTLHTNLIKKIFCTTKTWLVPILKNKK